MGGFGSKQISKKETNIVTDVLTDVIIDVSSRCDTSSLARQSLNNNQFIFSNISGSTLDISAVQDARLSLNAMCTSSNDIQSKLVQEFENKLKSTVNQKMEGLGIANTNKIEEINKIVSNIKTNVNMKSLTECLAKVASDQDMFNNVIKFTNIDKSDIKFSIKQSVVNQVVSKCILSNTSLLSNITELQNELENETTQVNKGFNLNEAIANVVDGLSNVINNAVNTVGMIWVLIIGGILCVLIFAPKLLCIIPGSQFLLGAICSSNKKVQNQPPMNFQPMPYDKSV